MAIIKTIELDTLPPDHFLAIGILLVISLFVICQIWIITSRYVWRRRRISIYDLILDVGDGKDLSSDDDANANANNNNNNNNNNNSTIGEQYIVRLRFSEQPPGPCSSAAAPEQHTRRCHVITTLMYANNRCVAIPLSIYPRFRTEFGDCALTFLRTNAPIADITSVRLQLRCDERCRSIINPKAISTHDVHGEDQDQDKSFDQLGISCCDVQNIARQNMISTAKKSTATIATTATSKQSNMMRREIHYTFACETPQPISPELRHLIRESIVCPIIGWAVCTYLSIAVIILTVAYMKAAICPLNLHATAIKNLTGAQFHAITLTLATTNATILFIGTHYLFQIWIVEFRLIASFGQRGETLHRCTVIIASVIALIAAIHGVAVMNRVSHQASMIINNNNNNNSTFSRSNSNLIDSIEACAFGPFSLLISFVAILAFVTAQAIICFVDQRTGWFDHVFFSPKNCAHAYDRCAAANKSNFEIAAEKKESTILNGTKN